MPGDDWGNGIKAYRIKPEIPALSAAGISRPHSVGGGSAFCRIVVSSRSVDAGQNPSLAAWVFGVEEQRRLPTAVLEVSPGSPRRCGPDHDNAGCASPVRRLWSCAGDTLNEIGPAHPTEVMENW